MIPEQTFFPDPALDRAFGVVMALATEVWVLRDRLAALEAQLAGRALVDRDALSREPADDAVRDERLALLAHLLQNLLGVQQAKGPR